MQREVSLQASGENTYMYQERLEIKHEDGTQVFEDEFNIRYWSADEVLHAAKNCGFQVLEDWSDRFQMTGSEYYVLNKPRGLYAASCGT